MGYDGKGKAAEAFGRALPPPGKQNLTELNRRVRSGAGSAR